MSPQRLRVRDVWGLVLGVGFWGFYGSEGDGDNKYQRCKQQEYDNHNYMNPNKT